MSNDYSLFNLQRLEEVYPETEISSNEKNWVTIGNSGSSGGGALRFNITASHDILTQILHLSLNAYNDNRSIIPVELTRFITTSSRIFVIDYANWIGSLLDIYGPEDKRTIIDHAARTLINYYINGIHAIIVYKSIRGITIEDICSRFIELRPDLIADIGTIFTDKFIVVNTAYRLERKTPGFETTYIPLPVKGGADDFLTWIITLSLFNVGVYFEKQVLLISNDKQKLDENMKTLISDILPTEEDLDAYGRREGISIHSKKEIRIFVYLFVPEMTSSSGSAAAAASAAAEANAFARTEIRDTRSAARAAERGLPAAFAASASGAAGSTVSVPGIRFSNIYDELLTDAFSIFALLIHPAIYNSTSREYYGERYLAMEAITEEHPESNFGLKPDEDHYLAKPLKNLLFRTREERVRTSNIVPGIPQHPHTILDMGLYLLKLVWNYQKIMYYDNRRQEAFGEEEDMTNYGSISLPCMRSAEPLINCPEYFHHFRSYVALAKPHLPRLTPERTEHGLVYSLPVDVSDLRKYYNKYRKYKMKYLELCSKFSSTTKL